MAPLSKLTLTSYRRTQPHRDPVEERRSKTLVALEQQKLVLAAALNGQEHTVTKPGWARDGEGNRQRIEKTHAVRLCTARSGIQSNVFADFDGSLGLLHKPSVRSKVSKENETLQQ